jgi:hypothetical protein
MLGPLLIDMAFLKTIGDYLGGNGWTSALVAAGIAPTGRVEAMLHCLACCAFKACSSSHYGMSVYFAAACIKQFIMQDAIGDLDTLTDFTSWCESQSIRNSNIGMLFYAWSCLL